MKRLKTIMEVLGNRILGMKLLYRMILLYMVGGILPLALIGVYLISGTRTILIEQAKATEQSELEMTGKQIFNNLDTVNSVSKYFYFDSKLEHIAFTEYTEYADLVEDYRGYTAFADYGDHYSRLIEWMSVFVDNDSITENARFVKVDESLIDAFWYQHAVRLDGAAAWQFIPVPPYNKNSLALTRLLKTTEGTPVGVLALFVRQESLQELILNREAETCIFLNGETELARNRTETDMEQVRSLIPEQQGGGIYQQHVELDGREYVMTCNQEVLIHSDDMLQIVSLKSYQDILQDINRQSAKSILIFAGSVLLAVTLILLFSRSFSRRVNRFRLQMQKAATGNFNLEGSLGGHDEISELYDYLGTMIYDIQRLLAEIYRERLHAEKLKGQQREAEFKMLASQINPHFLYNTLETIRMKARVNGQSEIEQLAKMFAKILRRNIQAGNQDVLLKNEVELVEYYLKIQQYRFGERIQYQIEMDQSLGECRILPLIIQPIVENSIIHGLETKVGIGTILILVRRDDENILISVEDDGCGISPEHLKKIREDLDSEMIDRTHIGISNVHQRLKLKYGDAYGVNIFSEEGVVTRVDIHIPYVI